MIALGLTNAQILQLKAGDKVWVSSGHHVERNRIEVVQRVTKTRIILGRGGEFDIFWRVPGSKYAITAGRQCANLTFRQYITYLATPDEWDAQVAAEKVRKSAEKKREDEKTDSERKQKALQLAFQGQPGVYVNSGARKSWTVSINDLTGEQVRDLARVLGGCFWPNKIGTQND